jgi:ABC-type xylose transport system substrate-binding protein
VRLLPISLALALTAPLLSGCLGGPSTVTLLVADGTGDAPVVDVEAFTAQVKKACDDCKVVVHDAEGDAETQKDQARTALKDESDVVVVWPVSAEEAEGFDFGEDAQVVSLVEFMPGSDRFVGLPDGLPAAVADQGSELDAARAVIQGERDSLIHVPAVQMSEQAATVATALLEGEPVPDGQGHEGVQSWLYEPVDVSMANLTTVLVGQGLFTLEELCTSETLKRCQTLGLV